MRGRAKLMRRDAEQLMDEAADLEALAEFLVEAELFAPGQKRVQAERALHNLASAPRHDRKLIRNW